MKKVLSNISHTLKSAFICVHLRLKNLPHLQTFSFAKFPFSRLLFIRVHLCASVVKKMQTLAALVAAPRHPVHPRFKNWAVGLAFCASLFSVSAAEAGASVKQTLFKSGDGQYHTYRIPAIVKTTEGFLLAFCEARESQRDHGDVDIVMRRSDDSGKKHPYESIVFHPFEIPSADPEATKNTLSNSEAAWKNLVGEKMANRPVFIYTENNENLPNVLLYGDSVSMDYTLEVRRQLAGKANVYRIYCNGGDSSSFIGKMQKMHQTMSTTTKQAVQATAVVQHIQNMLTY